MGRPVVLAGEDPRRVESMNADDGRKHLQGPQPEPPAERGSKMLLRNSKSLGFAHELIPVRRANQAAGALRYAPPVNRHAPSAVAGDPVRSGDSSQRGTSPRMSIRS